MERNSGGAGKSRLPGTRVFLSAIDTIFLHGGQHRPEVLQLRIISDAARSEDVPAPPAAVSDQFAAVFFHRFRSAGDHQG